MILQKWPKYYDFLGSFEKEHFLSKSRFGWLLGNFWLLFIPTFGHTTH